VGRRVGINVARKHGTPDEALGAVITALRLAKKWSHTEMSHRVGYSEKHLIAVERGTSSPTHKTIVATAQVFGLRASQLLARAERKYLKSQPQRRAPR
jgi:transcriptional regulator with XRE-family HTH domain